MKIACRVPKIREIVLDIETTGLSVREGHRIVEIGAVEVVDGAPTGREFHVYLDPGRPVPQDTAAIHGLTDDFLAGRPAFAAVAGELRAFIGESPIVITCRTGAEGHVLDRAFLDAEMAQAGFAPFPETRWRNLRPWSEEMFGQDGARLDDILDRYGIDRSARRENGHGALLDARLLAEAYPRICRDYAAHRGKAPPRPGKNAPRA